MTGFTEISAKALNRQIGLPDCPVLIDLRIPDDRAAIPYVIPGATHIPFAQIEDYLHHLTGRHVITICHKGLKISHGAAAILRGHGISAEVLNGGMVTWMNDNWPRIPMAALPATKNWVTRARPKIDRIACPWLIRRFVDRDARVLFVPTSEVLNVADRFDAIPFDVPDTPFTHHGSRCTFDALLDHYTLHTPALDRMADVIRAADTGAPDLSPEAAGLLAISIGLSRQFKDDTAQLAAALPVYDALYRWARDGASETHASFQDDAS